MQNQYLAAGNR